VSQTTGDTPVQENGGVILTFDDASISEWYLANSRLNDHNWKATFCVSFMNSLTNDEIQMLHELNNAGHEIAGHGYRHLRAVDYIIDYGVDKYLNDEIIPMNEWMMYNGFTVKSFAYPFGSRNEETDQLLFNYYNILRGVANSYYWKDASYEKCYFENSPLVYGFCIDESMGYFQHRDYNQYITDLLTYARDNNKILILLAHKTVDNINGQYQTKISTLDFICSFIDNNNMNYYTMSELNGMVNSSTQSARLSSESVINTNAIEEKSSASIRIFPNPFNEEENIEFVVRKNGDHVVLSVIDLTGKIIRKLIDDKFLAGTHTILWDGFDDNGNTAKTGMYLIRLKIGDTYYFERVIKH
jgi:peptidoglycan/xylan/chitin deacetylase (PgdA/CDA1 family)